MIGEIMSVELCVKREQLAASPRSARLALAVLVAGLVLFANGCGRQPTATDPATKPQESPVRVTATANVVLVDTPAAEFAIAPNGYVAASLVAGDRTLALPAAGSDSGGKGAADDKQWPPSVLAAPH